MISWICNSRNYLSSIDLYSLNVIIIVAIVLNALVLVVSIIIGISLPANKINYLTILSTISSLTASIFILIGYNSDNENTYAILVDLLAYSILRPITQLCDNYLVMSIFLLMDKDYSIVTMKIKLHLYIWIFLISTYVPYGTIVPIFTSMNEPITRLLYVITAAYIYLVAYLAYYITFGWKLRSLLAIQSNSELSTRNMIHIIISCMGATLASMEVIFSQMAPVGILLQITSISLSLQILFNTIKDRSPSAQSTMYTSRMLQYYQQSLYKYRTNYKISPRYRPRPVQYAVYENNSEMNVKIDFIEDASVANRFNNINIDCNNHNINLNNNNINDNTITIIRSNNNTIISPKGFSFDI